MLDGVTLNIDTRELEEKLSKLPLKIRRRAIRSSLLAGGQVIADAMAALAPERTDEPTPESDSLPPGILKADIKVQIQARRDFAPRVKIGPGEISGHVGRWIEQGWDLMHGGRKGKGGTFVRHIEGKHFMAQAFDEAAPAAIDAMLGSLSTFLDEADGGTEETTD